jgi:hypothetical protein
MQAMIEFHDTSIALSGLAHFLNLKGGGSYALASVQANTFVQAVQAYAESIRQIATSHIVEDLVDINFGPDVPAPKLVFDDIDSDQDATAAALNLLVQAGLLSGDVLIEQTLRQRLGFPAKPPGEPAATPSVGPAAPPKTPAPKPSGEPANSASPPPAGSSSAHSVVTNDNGVIQTGRQPVADQGRLF